METIKLIKENSLEALESLGIQVKEYPLENSEKVALLLDYSQIDSPKTHPVVRECRGLVLDKDTLEPLCRSFDRFFNYTETPCATEFNFNDVEFVEKADGSLIRVWWWEGTWHVSTRGTAFAQTPVRGTELTFRGLFLRALGFSEKEFQEFFNKCPKDRTYIFELCTKENRVVVRYEEDTVKFLGSRITKTGKHLQENPFEGFSKIQTPKKYTFEDMNECLGYVTDLEKKEGEILEGFVVYKDGTPISKMKSPLYVKLHHMRTGDYTLKNALWIIFDGEEAEYLAYFPSDAEWIQEAKDVVQEHLENAQELWKKVKGTKDRKEFALNVKNSMYSFLMFSAFNNRTNPLEEFDKLEPQKKMKSVLKWAL